MQTYDLDVNGTIESMIEELTDLDLTASLISKKERSDRVPFNMTKKTPPSYNNKVLDILYQEITNISEDKIQVEITKNNSSKIISQIISKCSPKIRKISTNIDEDLGIFAEGLMHYLLTVSLIPSQRKISKNNIGIDIVIPDILTLNSNPKDSLILLFPKSKNENLIKKRIAESETIQPIRENIWLILHHNLQFRNQTYLIQNDDSSLDKILDDINKFYSSKKQNKLKIMRS